MACGAALLMLSLVQIAAPRRTVRLAVRTALWPIARTALTRSPNRWRHANLRGARHARALGRVHGGVPGSLVGEF